MDNDDYLEDLLDGVEHRANMSHDVKTSKGVVIFFINENGLPAMKYDITDLNVLETIGLFSLAVEDCKEEIKSRCTKEEDLS